MNGRRRRKKFFTGVSMMEVVSHSDGSTSPNACAPRAGSLKRRDAQPGHQRVAAFHDDRQPAHQRVEPARMRQLVDVEKERRVHPLHTAGGPCTSARRSRRRCGSSGVCPAPRRRGVRGPQNVLVERAALDGRRAGQLPGRRGENRRRLVVSGGRWLPRVRWPGPSPWRPVQLAHDPPCPALIGGLPPQLADHRVRLFGRLRRRPELFPAPWASGAAVVDDMIAADLADQFQRCVSTDPPECHLYRAPFTATASSNSTTS